MAHTQQFQKRGAKSNIIFKAVKTCTTDLKKGHIIEVTLLLYHHMAEQAYAGLDSIHDTQVQDDIRIYFEHKIFINIDLKVKAHCFYLCSDSMF